MGQWTPFIIVILFILSMFPLVLFDRSQLKQVCNLVATSFSTANNKTRVIQLFRSFFEKKIENTYVNNKHDNISRNLNRVPRYLTHSLGNKLFKTYIIINLSHTVILIAELIFGLISLGLRMDSSNWPSVESKIFPCRVICLLNIGSLGQENLYIFQCTLSYQYTIVHILVCLLFYILLMIFFNIIYLIISIYIYKNQSRRSRECAYYFNFQTSNQFVSTQANDFIDYMNVNGYYVFIILQKNLTIEDFEKFHELLFEITHNTIQEEMSVNN
jgi:hypothetical protein